MSIQFEPGSWDEIYCATGWRPGFRAGKEQVDVGKLGAALRIHRFYGPIGFHDIREIDRLREKHRKQKK